MSHMCHIEIKCVTVMCDCYEMAPSQTDEIGVGGGGPRKGCRSGLECRRSGLDEGGGLECGGLVGRAEWAMESGLKKC